LLSVGFHADDGAAPLALSAPRDAATTREAAVLVRGHVAPVSARVIVMGKPVAVSGGGIVCDADPVPGTQLRPAAEVTLVVSRTC
jgi:hypothetical protein